MLRHRVHRFARPSDWDVWKHDERPRPFIRCCHIRNQKKFTPPLNLGSQKRPPGKHLLAVNKHRYQHLMVTHKVFLRNGTFQHFIFASLGKGNFWELQHLWENPSHACRMRPKSNGRLTYHKLLNAPLCDMKCWRQTFPFRFGMEIKVSFVVGRLAVSSHCNYRSLIKNVAFSRNFTFAAIWQRLVPHNYPLSCCYYMRPQVKRKFVLWLLCNIHPRNVWSFIISKSILNDFLLQLRLVPFEDEVLWVPEARNTSREKLIEN